MKEKLNRMKLEAEYQALRFSTWIKEHKDLAFLLLSTGVDVTLLVAREIQIRKQKKLKKEVEGKLDELEGFCEDQEGQIHVVCF